MNRSTDLEMDHSALPDSNLSNLRPSISGPFIPDEEQLIRAYFEHYHPVFPFIHEATFRRQYATRPDLTSDPGWLALRDIVLAIGAWCLQDTDNWVYSHSLSQQAKRRLDCFSIIDQPSIDLIQALLLTSDYYQRYGQPRDGWTFLGIATRMAISLGLHQEPSDDHSLLAKEIRRRVWWSVYCFDSCASKIFGLPLLLPDDKLITVKPVSNIADEVGAH